jgi:Fe-S-cluster containining protein
MTRKKKQNPTSKGSNDSSSETSSNVLLRDNFERTCCACDKCIACCIAKPGMLVPEDIPRQKQRFWPKSYWEKWFFDNHEASEGAMVVKDGRTFRIPTIVPRLTASGCVFLKDDRCTIWEDAPFGCSHTDTHFNAEEANRFSQASLVAILEAHENKMEYFYLWHALWRKNKRARPLQQRQAHLERLIEACDG